MKTDDTKNIHHNRARERAAFFAEMCVISERVNVTEDEAARLVDEAIRAVRAEEQTRKGGEASS